MKTFDLRSFAVLLMIAMSFAGCDAFEEADDVSFDTSFKLPQEIVVNETSTTPKNPYVSAVSTLSIDDPNYEI